MAGVWVYLLAIVLVPVALAVISHVLDSYRFGEMIGEPEGDWDTGPNEGEEKAA